MAKWEISSEAKREAKHIEALGAEEYKRRKAVVIQKRAELDENESYEVGVIIGGQFEPIAMQVRQETFDKMEKCHVDTWRRMVEKVCLS